MEVSKILQIKDITKIYKTKNGVVYANKNINMEIEDGNIIGFLGANGAGKTTLIKTICNLVTPTSGQVLINGEDIQKKPHLVHKHIGVLLEGARNLYNFLTVEANIDYFSCLNEIPKSELSKNKEYLLNLFELTEKRNEVVNNLSRGMQQKVAIIVAILKSPDLLILDEPTLGLDIISKLKMKQVLKEMTKELNKTLIISSHDIDVINDICGKIAVFHKGALKRYDSISNLRIDSEFENYKVVVRNVDYINEIIKKKDLTIMLKDNNFIEINVRILRDFIDLIKEQDLFKVEKKSHDIEEILMKIGETNEI